MTRGERIHTLPDSPEPSNNILISFFAMTLSRLSWFSISSLPEVGSNVSGIEMRKGRETRTGLGRFVNNGRLNATHFDKSREEGKVERGKGIRK